MSTKSKRVSLTLDKNKLNESDIEFLKMKFGTINISTMIYKLVSDSANEQPLREKEIDKELYHLRLKVEEYNELKNKLIQERTIKENINALILS